MGNPRMGEKPIEGFIEFKEIGPSASGKTRIWEVVNIFKPIEEHLGLVKWHGAWRKYVFEQEGTIIYDWGCLRYIADFIEEKTLEHRNGVKHG